MAKLTSTDKELFNNCREFLADSNMRVFFSRELRMMVGIVPETENGTIYKMFVTLCHKNDKFKKKLGLIELCNKFDNDNFNQVRILGSEDIAAFVNNYMGMFCNYGELDFQEMELN